MIYALGLLVYLFIRYLLAMSSDIKCLFTLTNASYLSVNCLRE